MATLRSSACLTIFLLASATLASAAGGPDAQPARETMRLPGWIQSIGEPGDTSPDQAAKPSTGSNAAGVVAAGGATEDAMVTLPVADWTSPKDTSPKDTKGSPSTGRVAAVQPANPAAQTGASFRRWISERVAALPTPTLPKPSSFLPGSLVPEPVDADADETATGAGVAPA